MTTPIKLNPAPFQLRGNLTAEQITALVALIAQANLIELPANADWANANGLTINVLATGTGSISVSFKQ